MEFYESLDHSSAVVTNDRTKRRKIECTHPVILGGTCIRCCTRDFDNDHSLSFEYLYPSLRLSKTRVEWVRKMRTEATLSLKKLHLVLDLDHTLVHSVWPSRLTPDEQHLVAEAEGNTRSQGKGCHSGDLFLLEREDLRMITKLRPFAREFVREVADMFELSVCTMGSRWYASEVVKLLDPDGCYFGHRIISREDCTAKGRKSLDVILAMESNTLIVDDSKDVWPDHEENLLVIKPYFYFSHRSEKEKQRLREMGWSAKDEEEEKRDRDEDLSFMLGDLSEIHCSFFDFEDRIGKEAKDVRELRLLIS